MYSTFSGIWCSEKFGQQKIIKKIRECFLLFEMQKTFSVICLCSQHLHSFVLLPPLPPPLPSPSPLTTTRHHLYSHHHHCLCHHPLPPPQHNTTQQHLYSHHHHHCLCRHPPPPPSHLYEILMIFCASQVTKNAFRIIFKVATKLKKTSHFP